MEPGTSHFSSVDTPSPTRASGTDPTRPEWGKPSGLFEPSLGTESDETSFAVDRDHAIAVAIMGDAQVRMDRADGRREDREILLERLGISPGKVSVRLRVDGDHVAAHLPQEEGRDRRGRTASAVDDDAELRGPQVLQDRLHVLLDQIGPR